MQFHEEFQQLFSGPPSGSLTVETLAELSARVQSFEERLDTVEREVNQTRGRGESKGP
jgi:hypothetical protein